MSVCLLWKNNLGSIKNSVIFSYQDQNNCGWHRHICKGCCQCSEELALHPLMIYSSLRIRIIGEVYIYSIVKNK